MNPRQRGERLCLARAQVAHQVPTSARTRKRAPYLGRSVSAPSRTRMPWHHLPALGALWELPHPGGAEPRRHSRMDEPVFLRALPPSGVTTHLPSVAHLLPLRRPPFVTAWPPNPALAPGCDSGCGYLSPRGGGFFSPRLFAGIPQSCPRLRKWGSQWASGVGMKGLAGVPQLPGSSPSSPD